jgi:hypothetical protein
MSAKEFKVSTAALPKDLDKAYAAAVGALSANKIEIAIKKPVWAKIIPIMEKAKVKAEFKIAVEWPKVTVYIDLGDAANVLGTLNVDQEKNLKNKRALVESLVKAGWADKSRLDALGPDPKEIEDKILKAMHKIADDIGTARDFLGKLQAQRKSYANIAYQQIRARPDELKKLEEFAKKEHNDENTRFLSDFYANFETNKLLNEYIRAGSPSEINLPAELRKDVVAGNKKPKDAAHNIESMIQGDMLLRFSQARMKVLDDGPIPAVTQKLASLVAQLRALDNQRKKLAA